MRNQKAPTSNVLHRSAWFCITVSDGLRGFPKPIAKLSFQHLMGVYGKAGEGRLIREGSNRTISNGFKLKKRDRLGLDFRRKFFARRVERHRNRLPKDSVDTPALEVFKASLDVALGNLVWWKGGWNQMIFKVTSNLNHSRIL